MNKSVNTFAGVSAGFSDPVADAQSVFRRILDATSHPGRVVEISSDLLSVSESGLSGAAAAIALTLLDFETPVWLDADLARAGDFIRFHCSAPLVARPEESRFAFASDLAQLPALTAFDLGSPDFPERSTTLTVEVPGLAEASGLKLHGPGIETSTALRIDGLPATFWTARAGLKDLFPLGIDLVFTSERRMAVVPRTTIVEV